jgi:hypothetical protein
MSALACYGVFPDVNISRRFPFPDSLKSNTFTQHEFHVSYYNTGVYGTGEEGGVVEITTQISW